MIKNLIAIAAIAFTSAAAYCGEQPPSTTDVTRQYLAELKDVIATGGNPVAYHSAATKYVDALDAAQAAKDKIAAEEAKPSLLKDKPAASADAPVSAERAPWEGSRDSQWFDDVEEALKYLNDRQEHTISRVEKLEKAMIQVKTSAGKTVVRSVPMVNGSGAFQLAPGESLTGYQDIGSGSWVSCNQAQAQVVRHIDSQPVRSYSSPPVQTTRYQYPVQTSVRTYAPSRQAPMRGMIRFSRCSGGSCG